MSHIYIHFPYCLYKCHYCDFNSHAVRSAEIPFATYTQALIREISLRDALYARSGTHGIKRGGGIETVFFGGGTPSLMRPRDIEVILQALRDFYVFADDIEITLEANPGTFDFGKYRDFVGAGINRISVGVQSLQDKYLKKFGRIHSAAEAIGIVRRLTDSGLSRVSADLIFGYPDQTLNEWKNELKQLLTTGLQHLSCYALTAELGTIFTSQVRSGKISETDSDLMNQMLELTYAQTENSGVPAYEISNFARPGEECRHNLAYWRYRTYLGLGAGACGQYIADDQDIFLVRDSNTKLPQDYLASLEGEGLFTSEKIEKATAISEYLMMGLRLREGISLTDFTQRFGEDINVLFKNEIKGCVATGLLVCGPEKIRPTHAGLIFNNRLVSVFI